MPRNAPPDPATPFIARHLIVYGRVQGVFYRQSMIDVATPLSLRGWVRNRSDGTVEALVQGPETAVQTLIAWANRGLTGHRWSALWPVIGRSPTTWGLLSSGVPRCSSAHRPSG